MRKVRDQNHKAAGQGELFPAWRWHPVFTDSPFTLIQAEEQHREHDWLNLFAAGCGPPPARAP